MSTLYPGAIDDTTTLPPPGPNTVTNVGTNSITHAGLHDNEILALQALETKLGIGSSTSTTSTVLRASSSGTSVWGKLVLTSDVTGILPIANGGTGGTGSTGTGNLVFSNSPTLTTPVISSPTGLVKGDVGLGNVDNTSDTSKNSASVSLTNKDLTATSNIFPSGFVFQVVSTNFGTAATGTTTIPFDDTIPQITEGTEFMTQAITPKSATNRLSIDVMMYGSYSAIVEFIIALFQDSTANALAANSVTVPTSGYLGQVTIRHDMVAGTTSSTTFRVRAGGSGAGTMTFNGTSGTRRFGGITLSNIKITEYKP